MVLEFILILIFNSFFILIILKKYKAFSIISLVTRNYFGLILCLYYIFFIRSQLEYSTFVSDTNNIFVNNLIKAILIYPSFCWFYERSPHVG